MFENRIEIDESYFGSKRKGKRGRHAIHEECFFGLLKHQDKIYTTIQRHQN